MVEEYGHMYFESYSPDNHFGFLPLVTSSSKKITMKEKVTVKHFNVTRNSLH